MTTETTGQTATGDTTAADKVETTAATTETTVDANKTATENATADKTERATIAGSEPADKTATAPADWPDDWRVKMAAGDDKFLKKLERYTSPLEFSKAHRALEQKLGTGEVKKELAKDAKPEEIAAWRKENGIPEEPKGYIEALALPDGVVLGEADKPVAESFAKAALENNWSPKQYNEAVDWYFKHVQELNAQREDADDKFHAATEDALRAEWGADYKKHINAVGNILSTMPDDMHLEHKGRVSAGGKLLAARLPDGTLLGDHPSFVKWLANQAMELNPAATIVPVGTSDPGKSVESRLAEISHMRINEPDKYAQNKRAIEAEEVQLIDAQLNLRKRGRAA